MSVATTSAELTLPAGIVLPTTREEAWRYTPVDEIAQRLATALPTTSAVVASVESGGVDVAAAERAGVDLRGPRFVLVDGAVAWHLSDIGQLPAGAAVRVHGTAEHRDDVDPSRAPARDDGFQALNRIGGGAAVVVEVERDVEVAEPIQVVHLATTSAGPRLRQPRTTIHARAGSTVTVVETYRGMAADGVTNACTVVRADRGATVRYLRVQDDETGSTHVGHTRVAGDAAADVQVLSVMLGADIARHAIDAQLLGPGARVQLDGVTVPVGHQRHDHVVTVEHVASHGVSRQRFRAVVDDHARSSFSGHVIVPDGTKGTDADQSSRNVLLARTAEADSRPWLEIFSDDVRCTHGATVGRLDDDALFYLRSRGIAQTEARRVLVAAFVHDVVEAIEHEPSRERIAALVAARVGSADDQGGVAR